jgi:hypothetical protein
MYYDSYEASVEVQCGNITSKTTFDSSKPLTGAPVNQVLACINSIMMTEVAMKSGPLMSDIPASSKRMSDKTESTTTRTYEIGDGIKITVYVKFILEERRLDDALAELLDDALDQLHVVLKVLPKVWNEDQTDWRPFSLAKFLDNAN